MNELKIHMTGLIAFGRRQAGALDVAALVNHPVPTKTPSIEEHCPCLWLGEIDETKWISLKGRRVEIFSERQGKRGSDDLKNLTRMADIGAGAQPRSDIFRSNPDENRVATQVEIDRGILKVTRLVEACFEGEEREATQINFARSHQIPPQRTQPAAEVVTWTVEWEEGDRLEVSNLADGADVQHFIPPRSLSIWITNSPRAKCDRSCHELRRPGMENAHFYLYQKFVLKGELFYPKAIVAHIPSSKIDVPIGFIPGSLSVNNRPMCPPVMF